MKNRIASQVGVFFFIASLALSVPASAHITVDPKEAPAGGYAKLVFRVPHGCNGSPTTKITIQIPEGVLSVKPQVHSGWEIAIKKPKEGSEAISEVSWSGGPLPDEYMDEFGMSVKLPDHEGTKLVFPVTQECKTGVVHWSAAAASGNGDTPAPALMLTHSSQMGEHHHH